MIKKIEKEIETILTDYLGDNLETIYSQVGPTTGISGDENAVFEGENTAQILIKLNKVTSSLPLLSISLMLNPKLNPNTTSNR